MIAGDIDLTEKRDFRYDKQKKVNKLLRLPWRENSDDLDFTPVYDGFESNGTIIRTGNTNLIYNISRESSTTSTTINWINTSSISSAVAWTSASSFNGIDYSNWSVTLEEDFGEYKFKVNYGIEDEVKSVLKPRRKKKPIESLKLTKCYKCGKLMLGDCKCLMKDTNNIELIFSDRKETRKMENEYEGEYVASLFSMERSYEESDSSRLPWNKSDSSRAPWLRDMTGWEYRNYINEILDEDSDDVF